jgi:hypothetical protein
MRLMVFALGLACTLCVSAQENASTVSFTVVRDYNGKPVRNASVVLHPVDKNGKQSTKGPQLKTDANGKTSYAGVPFGRIRVQVIAPSLQTYGEDYDINTEKHEILIKLKRPQEQFSIYDKKEGRKEPKQEPKQDEEKK